MSRVLEFADEVAGLTPGLDQVQTITNDFTTTANKNSVFFGSVTFNATNPVAVVANSELIFHDADVDFKQGFNLQGTLNWITGGGTADKDVSGLQINGTTVIDSARNISNVPLIQATQANIGTNALVVSSDGKVGIGTSSPASKFYVSHTTSDVSAAAASRNPIASFSGGNANNRLDVYVDNSGGTAHMGLGAYNLAGGATELGFYTGGSVTERMRIDSNGNVGIGTSSPNHKLEVKDDDIAVVKLTSAAGGNAVNGIRFRVNNSADTAQSATLGKVSSETVSGWGGTLSLQTKLADGNPSGSLTERMRIYSNGSTSVFATNADVMNARSSVGANASNSLYTGFHTCTGLTGGTLSFNVTTNGNVTNSNNSYGPISDIKLKENIVDAPSQWDDLKALQVRKFNFKSETGHSTHTQIGVIAQEVELVSPGLVSESPDQDAEGNDLGTVTKSVKSSVLYMKAIKALQEAMERVESQQSQIDALTARITALENQ